MSFRTRPRPCVPSGWTQPLLLALAVVGLTACAPSIGKPGSLVAGGTTDCGGTRYLDVRNHLDRDVTIFVRLGDGRRIVLEPALLPREERRYELPRNLLVVEVYGLAEPMMRSARVPTAVQSRVDVQPVASCHGFPRPAS